MIELKCDKCGKKIDIAMYLEAGGIIKRNTCVVNFRFEILSNDVPIDRFNAPSFIPHETTLDICPDCQELIIKDILGHTPWMEGK